jgi:hypothetical protein
MAKQKIYLKNIGFLKIDERSFIRNVWVFKNPNITNKEPGVLSNYFTMRGGSLKKIAKKIIPNVPINKKV